jgi:hypothetical protein
MKTMIMKLKIFSATVIFSLSALAQNSPVEIEHPLEELIKQVVKSSYPIEKVGVIARSVTFPSVLDQGQAIIDTKYPNASILCLDVANYSGLATGLIWSMDRELVEEYSLHYLIDRASIAFFSCVDMFMPPELLIEIVEQQMGQGLPQEHARRQDNVGLQVANRDAAASPEMEKTPALSMEDAKKAVVAQIEHIQEMIRFAQTVKSRQNE